MPGIQYAGESRSLPRLLHPTSVKTCHVEDLVIIFSYAELLRRVNQALLPQLSERNRRMTEVTWHMSYHDAYPRYPLKLYLKCALISCRGVT